jgi:DNA-directed RNA polymerase specialized sigma24 family protein
MRSTSPSTRTAPGPSPPTDHQPGRYGGPKGTTVTTQTDHDRREQTLRQRGTDYQTARSLRDEAIRQAHTEGMTYRQIADAVGLSHTGVAKIVRR